ncbi:MAG: hypothetical protein E7520_03145 [Ruminococcaceae bacterium]|nr:hypothetical protein [Oscillospiraceae bacterium]
MKKRIKQSFSLLLVIALISTAMAGFGLRAFAATNGTSGALRWALDDTGTFTVNGVGYGENYANSITNRAPWYSLRGSIKKIIVQDGVQAIGDYWFNGCNAVTSAELPASLVKIGASCFRSCSALQSITLPAGCSEFYDNTFNGCTALRWAVLPEDCTTTQHQIPDNTFYGCTNLENVWVGANYTGVANGAFRNCTKLSAVIWTGDTLSAIGSYFPSGASIVGTNAIQRWCSENGKNFIGITGDCGDALGYRFDFATKALALTGSGAMTTAPWNAWHYFICGVDFGSATSVCDGAFQGCESLAGELTLPENLRTVGANAFYHTGYDCVTVNAESISIGETAFGSENLIFYGRRGSGVYDYVKNRRTTFPAWRYYCINSHSYGGDSACDFCDKVHGVPILPPCGEHQYIYQYRIGNQLYYKCGECDADDYCVGARDLLLDFDCALNSNDGRFDIWRDGTVNGKDYKVIRDIRYGKPTEIDRRLTNENATAAAQALYRYINSVYGNRILSGQQESTWMGSPDYEMNYIYENTGKYPAIRGLDFMNDDFDGVVARAKAWAKRGGIVSICWHCGPSFNGSFDESQNEELTAAQWEAVLTDGTAENAAFIAAMDKAGNALLQLQDAGIPVLWRPFHEFDGAWFWWGKGGSENFKRLWRMMYNHFTYDLGLNNLIWVLGYSHNGTDYGTNLADWYPGSRYCDIAGADSYEVSTNGAEGRLFNPVSAATHGAKPLVMHETGLIPTVEEFKKVPWGYFLTWHTEYVTDHNTPAHLSEVYNSDYVITLDELPNIS